MKPLSPVIPGENFEEIIIAKDQSEYMPLPVIPFQDGVILSRWELDKTERRVIAVTGVLYICLLTFGREIPVVKFQVDSPVAADALDNPEQSCNEKTLYIGTDLPVFQKTNECIWLVLKLTDKDQETITEHGNFFFFMHTEGQPITPSMMQVETPVGQDVDFIVGLRAIEKNRLIAAQNNLEVFESECCICAHKIILSNMWKDRISSGEQKPICTICAEDSSLQRCVLPETIDQLRTIHGTDKN